MDASSSTSFSRRWPVAFLVALALVVAGEGAIAMHRHLFVDAFFRIAEDKRARLASGEVHSVLVIGDSSMFHVPPEIAIEELGLGGEGANLAWPFSGLGMYEHLLDDYLRHRDEAPDLVITAFMPNFVAQDRKTMLLRDFLATTDEPDLWTTRIFSSLTAGGVLRAFLRERLWKGVVDYAKYRSSPPSLQLRGGIFRALADWLAQRQVPTYEGRDVAMWDRYSRLGRFPVYGDEHQDPSIMLKVLEDVFGRFENREDEALAAAFERFLALSEKRGIPVIIIPTPCPQYMQEFYTARGVMPFYERTLAGWDAKYEMLKVAEPRLWVESNDLFGDPGHVNAPGAGRYNDFLEAWMREHREEVAALVEAGRARRAQLEGMGR